METIYNKWHITIGKLLSGGLFFWFIFLCTTVNAQEEIPQDSTGYDVGIIQIKNPPSIVDYYTYDPVLDRYVFDTKVGEFSINYPMFLTPKEYEELITKETIKNYFQEKSRAMDSEKPDEQRDILNQRSLIHIMPNRFWYEQRDLLPRYYVNSGFFETVFGSNTIDIKPSGFVEVDLGGRFTKQDNPSLSPRNRSNFSFDFDQRISVGLMGMVGTRLKVTANYDTQSSFDFQNLIKLEYIPSEDDIIQKIEVGNVSMPLNTSLIRGAQSLFGVKTELQFGRTRVTGIFSEQRSQTRGVVAEGGGTIENFEIFALDYDADRHYFLSQYFRNKYDDALKNYPLIDSRVQITRIEVWVTNRQNRINASPNDGFNNRNIIALQDLGEAQLPNLPTEHVRDFLMCQPILPQTTQITNMIPKISGQPLAI